MDFFGLDDIKYIFNNRQFLRLWLTGTSSGIARWLEVMCFSVFAWQISGDATTTGFIMTLRFVGVIFSGFFFLFLGGKVSGQVTMILMHILLSINCSLGIFLSLNSAETILVIALISFSSGMLWSADFSFRRRMLADRLDGRLIGKGLAIDVTSTHATRLLAMFFGGILISTEQTSNLFVFLFYLYSIPLILMYFEKDDVRPNNDVESVYKFVFNQAQEKFPIKIVLFLTPIYNIFVLPYLALITLVFLEKFQMETQFAGYFSSLEGAGALLGGILVSILQPNNRQFIFVGALFGLLAAIYLIGSLPYMGAVILILFFAGILSAVYSSMQSTLIYINSRTDLRSPTFSLMTIGIGLGLLGTANIAWMGNFFSVSYILTFMAIEGIIALFIVFLSLWLFEIMKRKF